MDIDPETLPALPWPIRTSPTCPTRAALLLALDLSAPKMGNPATVADAIRFAAAALNYAGYNAAKEAYRAHVEGCAACVEIKAKLDELKGGE